MRGVPRVPGDGGPASGRSRASPPPTRELSNRELSNRELSNQELPTRVPTIGALPARSLRIPGPRALSSRHRGSRSGFPRRPARRAVSLGTSSKVGARHQAGKTVRHQGGRTGGLAQARRVWPDARPNRNPGRARGLRPGATRRAASRGGSGTPRRWASRRPARRKRGPMTASPPRPEAAEAA